MRRLICHALTLWYSLRTFNPFTPLGAVPISGHAYVEEPSYTNDGRLYEPLRCERCGDVAIGWR